MTERVRLSTKTGRYILLATVLGSGIAMLDATMVNVALARIGATFGASLAGLQWITTGYTLTLAAFILLGGSLGDRYGRRLVFVVGTVWFVLASLLCGLAQNVPMLVAARIFQGIGGALLTPGSLALIQSTIVEDDRSRAIGAWSGLGGIAGAVGPFLGGWMVDTAGWRWVFFINVPLGGIALALIMGALPRTPVAHHRFDWLSALLSAATFGMLITGIDSDTPAHVLAQVAQNVYDTASGRYLLIPQGSRVIGDYSVGARAGQQRVVISWKRLGL